MSRRRASWKREHKGNTLRSGLEFKIAQNLEKAKMGYKYEEVDVTYTVPESKHKYKPDFVLDNGIVIEAKGRFTPADRRKMALVTEQNPDLDIRMLFMVDNTLSKSSKTKYTDWCKARGIPCHVSREGDIPKDWLKTKTKRKRRKQLDESN